MNTLVTGLSLIPQVVSEERNESRLYHIQALPGLFTYHGNDCGKQRCKESSTEHKNKTTT